MLWHSYSYTQKLDIAALVIPVNFCTTEGPVSFLASSIIECDSLASAWKILPVGNSIN